MKHNAIVGNIGHFDNEIDMAGLETLRGVAAGRTSSRRSTSGVLPERPLDHRARRGPPDEPRQRHRAPELRDERARSPTRCVAQIELFTNTDELRRSACYVLPKHLDEKVARLHLDALGVKLTELTDRAGRVPRRPGRGPLQARPLPLLGFRVANQRLATRLQSRRPSAALTCWWSDRRSPLGQSRGNPREGA